MLEDFTQSLLCYIQKTDYLYAHNYVPGVATHPIPFFGDPTKAKILTVGVNPAVSEFRPNRAWPESVSSEYLENRLKNYFHFNECPPHTWFESWERAIGLLGLSYYNNEAAHLDLSPRATINMGEVPDMDIFLEMVKADIEWFFKLLKFAPNVRLIIIAGTVTKKYYMNEFIHRCAEIYGFRLTERFKKSENPGKGKTYYHKIIGENIELPVFFCSVSPSAQNNFLLFERVRENLNKLTGLISEA